MIRCLLVVCGFLFCQFNASAQLKKSCYGKYSGTIPAYEINTGMEKIGISEAKIEIMISAKELFMKIGNQEFNGTWSVLFEAKSYYVLVGKMNDQPAPERIIVYKKGKKISREGIRPQPDVMLAKDKR